MFENVLVGVDGSWGGADAIALATRLAAPNGRLTLAHVRRERWPGAALGLPGAPGETELERERTGSEQLLEEARYAAGVEAELCSLADVSPGRGLHRQAERQAADLIVLGSCHRGMLGRAMLGDDARGALNGAPCAVAIAARGYAEQPRALATIGVGYDGSAESRAALERARELTERVDGSLRALEVVMLPGYVFAGLALPALGEAIEGMLQDAGDRMRELPGVDGRAVYGVPGEELARFGDEVDLLVVGSRNYGPLRRLVLGSTSEYLERHARCSLLVLPRIAHEAGSAMRDTR